MKKKVLGIMGGMGPEATAYMFRKIVKLTRADRDQDHIEIFIHNNPNIPDRTRAVLYGGSSPLEELFRSGLMLERAGVDLIIIPCITAHYYLDDLRKRIAVPILDAIRETALWVHGKFGNVERVGIIGSTGTIRSGMLQSMFHDYGLDSIVPADEMQQESFMMAIYGEDGIKAGHVGMEAKEKLLRCCEFLIQNGAQAIVAGCTEVPLVIGQKDVPVPFVDPMDVVARIAIRECLGDQCLA